MLRLNGDLMKYNGEKIMWWKLRDLFTDAAQTGNVEVLQSIVEEYPEAPGKWTGGLFGTGLYFAAQEGKLDAVKFLMDNGAKLGVEANDGLSPLIAAAFNGHGEVVDYLLSKGADVNETDKRQICGYTALSWAAYHGHAEAAKHLLERGADTSLKNIDGKTARQLAVQQGHPEVAKLIDTLDTRVYMYKNGTDERVKVSKPLSFKMK
ncbi:MAG: ankyrin repeat domain-containing protein [Alphaproteobacteria bacterium]|nr:MAG: ankyrin repeat domain-containing protein [Alphaproteobacteria bacterium]